MGEYPSIQQRGQLTPRSSSRTNLMDQATVLPTTVSPWDSQTLAMARRTATDRMKARGARQALETTPQVFFRLLVQCPLVSYSLTWGPATGRRRSLDTGEQTKNTKETNTNSRLADLKKAN